ncbi:hypothetical protein Tco_1469875 [Tanacetum coccineum]
MQTAFSLMSNAFARRYSTPTNNNQRISSNTQNKHIAQPMNMNQGMQMQMVVVNPGNQGNRQTQFGVITAVELVTMKGTVQIDQGSGILHATQMVNPTSSNTDTALVYDTVGISEVPNFDHYYDNEMCNLFTYEEQHPNLHESTHGTSVEYQNNSNIYSKYLDMDFVEESRT